MTVSVPLECSKCPRCVGCGLLIRGRNLDERAALVSLPNLMNHINTIQYFSQWQAEVAAAQQIDVAFHMGETGSVSCHGKDGVSNTVGAALWEIDYMLHGKLPQEPI